MINGCVGDGAGTEFTAVLETRPARPEDVLVEPQTLRLPQRGDLAVAIVRSILARVETDNSRSPTF
jgi:hypothetical protein